jgi:hypothetical protein
LFGPVPTMYRAIVWLCGLAAFAGLGVLIAPALSSSSMLLAVAGLTVGAFMVVLFLHDFEHAQRVPVKRRP